MDGHFAGAKNTIDLFKHVFSTTEVKAFTGWFLSTENLHKRSAMELDFIFNMYKTIGNDLDEFMAENDISFKWIGSPEGLPADLIEFLENKEKIFSYPETDRYIIFAINYGGRDEIIRGVKNMLAHEKDISMLNEDTLSKYMDLGSVPPVELVIRTK